jgi:SAM-dependent methyltransferase
MSSGYASAWESYWRDLPPRPQESIFDSEPELTAARELPLFEKYFAPDLPLVDLGCGTGTQTRFFGTRFRRVIGVDFSPTVLELSAAYGGNVEYRRLDLRDEDAVTALHNQIGDANVYMRGILHQMETADRPVVVANIVTLIGDQGHLFDTELAAEALPIMKGLADHPDGMPPKVAAIFTHGLKPGAWGETDQPDLLIAAGLDVVTSGTSTLYSTEYVDGSRLELPMFYAIAHLAAAPPA